MTKEANDVLTRDSALKNFMSPMGRKYGAIKDPKNPGLCRIGLVDGRPGDIPKEFEGSFTKPSLAEQTITDHLKKLWDQSDEVKRTK